MKLYKSSTISTRSTCCHQTSSVNVTRYLSVLSLIIILGYITYREARDSEHNPTETLEPEITVTPGAKSIPTPSSMTFAGEEVPLHESDVRERLDRELHINTYWHNNTIFLIKRAHRWFPAIEEVLAREGVPDDFKYLTAIEGSLRNDISPKNAVGFWQIRRATGRELGLEISREVDERYNPLRSTEAACRYIKKAYERFGNWTMVAAAYNRGMAGMARAIEDQQVDSYYDLLLNEETYRYVFRILAIKEIIENPDTYYFEVDEEHLYEPYELTYVEVSESIPDLVTFSQEQGINYKILKLHNPWLRQGKLTVRSGHTYQIAIPTTTP